MDIEKIKEGLKGVLSTQPMTLSGVIKAFEKKGGTVSEPLARKALTSLVSDKVVTCESRTPDGAAKSIAAYRLTRPKAEDRVIKVSEDGYIVEACKATEPAAEST